MSKKQEQKIKHVAIIMDGNGRWAQARRHRRIWGHVKGSSVVSRIVEEASNIGVKSLTLYAFSSENFSRPIEEVKTLFLLLKKYLQKERQRLIKNEIRFKVIGDYSALPDETKNMIISLESETKNLSGMKLNFAFGYGSRKELIKSFNRFIQEHPGKSIDESELEKYLSTSDSGDVDLMIRTGGDYRISNFLLWQSAYAELFFTNTPWPEFTTDEFKMIIESVESRERRFGQVCATMQLSESQIVAKKNEEILKTSKSNE